MNRLLCSGFLALILSVLSSAQVAVNEENWLRATGSERISGRLEAGGRDLFVLNAIRGTRLDLDLRWSGEGEGSLQLYGPAGVIDLQPFLRTRSQRARARRIVLEETGEHYVAIIAERAGPYLFALRARTPRKLSEVAEDRGTGVNFDVLAAAGDLVLATWKAPRGSSYRPRLRTLRTPSGASADFEVLRENDRELSIRFRAEEGGAHDAEIEDEEGLVAAIALAVRLKPERLNRRERNLELAPAPLEAFPRSDITLEPWRLLHRLAELETTVRSYQEASFDRTAGNDDGLSGVHTILRIEGNEAVVFDQEGPGIIERIHFAFRSTPGTHLGYLPDAEQYRVKFFFDDEATPRIDLPVKEFVSGLTAPFFAPAVGNDTISPGGPFVYTPIPFARRLVVRTTGPAFYLHVNWRRVEVETNLASFEPATVDTTPLLNLLHRQGEAPHAATRFASRHDERLDLPPGGVGTAFLHEGAGWIAALEIVPDSSTRALISDVQIELSFDGASVPDVDCPVDLFFGCGLGEAAVRSLLFEMVPDGAYRCWWPMPFSASAVLRIRNRSRAAVGFEVRTHYLPLPYGGRFGTFRAQVHEAVPPPLKQWIDLRDFRMYAATGQGKIVGLSMVVGSDGLLGSPQQRTYLEGDEHVHVDGMRTPTHHGTGTEEIWNWGWYEAAFAVPFALELHGFPARRIRGLADYTSGYRVMVGDPIPYASEVLYGVEQGPEGYDAARYLCVAFAYHRADPAAEFSDVIDVGDPASEVAHAYQGQSSTLIPAFSSQFEGERLEPVLSLDGRREASTSRFRLALSPFNRGAWLRRVFDAADQVPYPQVSVHYGPGQRARVFVDGVEAGIWHSAHRNIWRRFRESEFAIPAALCVGKASIEVQIEPLSVEWNALEYRLISRLR